MAKTNATIRPLTAENMRLAKMLKALGNPVRFQIVQILAEKQICITGEIVEFTTLAQSTVSQHLKVLREAGILAGEVDETGNLLLFEQHWNRLAEGKNQRLAATLLRRG